MTPLKPLHFSFSFVILQDANSLPKILEIIVPNILFLKIFFFDVDQF